MLIGIDPHGTGHPSRDAPSWVSDPIDVRDERATVKQGEVAGTQPTVGPESSECDPIEVRPELVEQTQPLAALPEPID
jgi:hypothetical protein